MRSERQRAERAAKESYWQPHLGSWQSSGLSAIRYCKEHNVNHHQFKYWQYQLAPHTRKAKPSTQDSAIFVEVKPKSAAVVLESSHFEIKTDHGFNIKVCGDGKRPAIPHTFMS